ncbi:type IV secretory system conjugative DNA transfer family protein [Paracoccus yeei]|uniref:TraG conjugal transfer transmembrane protein n=1 Tax=Paracoccus yeei TaxID=147645 RepID=A0A0D5A1N6_9RHOB|nr:type IV secretory system conjugative DNA transfer family protein [Paracoccus yeei]AJW30093.1 TraG conjugal transfer transmembrane protein [Paracoccus yeei]
MIGRAFRFLAILGRLAIALPVGILFLLFALLLGTGAGLLAFVILRGLLTGTAPDGADPATIWGMIGMMLCLLPAWALSLAIWAEFCGLGPLFARRGFSHGSARFSSKAERAAFQRGEGLLIGRDADTGRLLRYDGPAHLITLAPTRAGKGVGTIVPNLLTVNRSVMVIDPQGENARITAQARQKFGAVHVLDPFGVTGLPGAAYNPLDRLTPDSLGLGEDAAALAEALQDIARDAERPQEPPGGLSGPCPHSGGAEGTTDALSAALWPAERLKTLPYEFAALGRLEAMERAMGLMAGYGIQLWPILQDMSQLKDLYGTRAGTFIANAGIQQVFGVNDLETAKWLS